MSKWSDGFEAMWKDTGKLKDATESLVKDGSNKLLVEYHKSKGLKKRMSKTYRKALDKDERANINMIRSKIRRRR